MLKLYLFHFLMGFHMISGVLLPFFLTWGKLSFVEVMVLQSFFTVMILVLEIPCGAIADRISRKFSLVLGAISTSLAALVYGSVSNIYVFMVGEGLFALGRSLISGTDQAFLYDTLKKVNRVDELSKFAARNRSFSLLGITISAPVGSLIGSIFSLNIVMTLMFVPFGASVIIAFGLEEPLTEISDDDNIRSENYVQVIKTGFRRLKSNKILRILAFDLIMVESTVFFLLWIYQLYLEELKVPMEFFGFVSAAMTISQIAVANLIPVFKNHVKKLSRLLFLFTVLPGVGIISMVFVHFAPISIALILMVIGIGFTRNILFVEGINKQIESKNRATVISTINMMTSVVRSLTYPLVGNIVALDLNATLICLGVVILMMGIFTRVKTEDL